MYILIAQLFTAIHSHMSNTKLFQHKELDTPQNMKKSQNNFA